MSRTKGTAGSRAGAAAAARAGPSAPAPATITGGPFHYAIGGTVTDTGFSLELSSEDAKVKFDGPSADACQLLAALGEGILDQFVKGPFPVDFEVAPGQTTVSYDESDGGTSFKATSTRVKA